MIRVTGLPPLLVNPMPDSRLRPPSPGADAPPPAAEDGPRGYVTGRMLTVVKTLDGIDPLALVNLSTNECCLGPAPGVAEAVAEAGQDAHRYADTACSRLRQAIGAAHGLDPARIVCGNGSEEILDLVGRIHARPGDEILFPAQSFLQFSIVAWRVGASAVTAPLGPGFAVDPDAVLAAVTPRTRIVFLADPNNPTGVAIAPEAVQAIARGLRRDIVLVLDCAYAEFAAPGAAEAALDLARRLPNVLVTRTYSKAYGMAGLRLGWAFGAPGLIAPIDAMRGIGNVSGPTQAAGIVALEARAHVARVIAHAHAEREFLAARLAAAGFEVVPSATNFVLARMPAEAGETAQAAVLRLARAGYLIRANEDYDLPDWLRITVGHRHDMIRVAELLARPGTGVAREAP